MPFQELIPSTWKHQWPTHLVQLNCVRLWMKMTSTTDWTSHRTKKDFIRLVSSTKLFIFQVIFLFKSRPCKLLNMFCMQSFWKFSDDLVSFSFFPYFIELFFNVHVKLPTYFIIRSINRVVQNALCFFSYYLTKTLLGLQYTK